MSIMNGINKGADVLNTYLSTKKERIGKGLINAVLLFIIFAVFGCFDFLTLTFTIENILTLEFWATIISKTIAGVCAFNIGINIAWELEIKKNELLIDLKTEYNRLVKFIDDKTFEYYVINVFNKKEKKAAWIDKVNRKIYILNKFSKHKDQILYNTDSPEKETNKYCIKRKELETIKTDEYIDKNIDGLPVRYNEVDPILFRLEIDSKITVRGAKVQGNATIARSKMTSSVALGMVLISMFMTSLALQANKEMFEDKVVAFWNYFLRCCEDVGVVLWQAFRGILKTRKIIDSEFIQPYAGRIRVLNDYINWCNENNIETSKAYKIMKEMEATE